MRLVQCYITAQNTVFSAAQTNFTTQLFFASVRDYMSGWPYTQLQNQPCLHNADMMPKYSKLVPKSATVTSYHNTFTATTELHAICKQRCSVKTLEITTSKQSTSKQPTFTKKSLQQAGTHLRFKCAVEVLGSVTQDWSTSFCRDPGSRCWAKHERIRFGLIVN